MLIFSFNRASGSVVRFLGLGVFFPCLVFFNCSMIHGIFTLNLHVLHNYSLCFTSSCEPEQWPQMLHLRRQSHRYSGLPSSVLPAAFPINIPTDLVQALCSYSKVTAPWVGWSKARTFSPPLFRVHGLQVQPHE